MAQLFVTPQIISASRRTDIPRYFGRWFEQRRRAGRAAFRSAYGTPGEVSLRDEDVIGYLFWTKNARPFRSVLRSLRDDGIPYVFQYTLNAYGRDIEPRLPHRTRLLDDFLTVARDLPGPEAIQWRYDPILITEHYDQRYHCRQFGRLAAAVAGATRVVNTSVVEPYLKALRRMPAGVSYRCFDPGRHKTVAKQHPDLPQLGSELTGMFTELRDIAAAHGIELRACSNPEWDLAPSQCCSAESFAPYGRRTRDHFAALEGRPTRSACRCLASADIGMDNTCLSGCKYCYVVTSHARAVQTFRHHDPRAESLR